jgi:hypothetical protein
MSPRAADSARNPPSSPAGGPISTLAPSRPQTAWQWVRLVGNVVNLTTLLGLAAGAIGGARFRWGPRGLILGEGYRFRFPVAGAFTIGNVSTTARDWESLINGLPTLLTHEERHTWQYLYCLGLPFYLFYSICMGWSWLRTGDRAARNFFERRAGLRDGGYLDLPTRSIGAGIHALFQLMVRRSNRPGHIKNG